MRHCVTCKSDSKTIATKKRQTRRTTLHTSRALLLSLVLAIFASLSLFMPSALQAQAEGAANDTSYAMSIGGAALKEGAQRQPDAAVAARFYLGQAPWGDIDSGDKTTPALWDVLGPANTNQTLFKADYDARPTTGDLGWGVYSSKNPTGEDLTNSSILAISHNVTTTSDFSNSGNQAYQGSNLKNAMDNSLSYLSQPEKAFALYTYKTDAATTDIYSGVNFMDLQDILQGSQFFPLSGREAVTYWANTSTADSLRQASGANNIWWLRSADSDNFLNAGIVGVSGDVSAGIVDGAYGVRAAFNSNLNTLAFTSLSGTNYVLPAYDTGTAELKSMTVEDAPQVPVYRLTLLDSNLNNCAPKSTSPIKAAAGSTVTLGYEGAVAKNSAYVTCYIADAEENILYAGHIAKTDAAEGQAQVKIPEVLPAGDYSLVVYEEQDNNCNAENFKGKLTNYAGEIKDDKNVIKLTVEAQPDKFTLTYKAEEGGTVDPTAEQVQQNQAAKGSTAKANLGYTFTNWTDEEGNIVSDNATFVPIQPDTGWKNTTYTAHFTKSDQPTEQVGWNYNESGGWYYVYDNEGHTYNDGWHWIEDAQFGNHWYYFMSTGFIKTNEWIFDDVNTSWYYVNSSGSMNVGTWNWIGNAWYGFNWDGSMCRGWTFDSSYNNWFYCDPSSGAMYTNCWSFINGSWYGFWANGEMCRGWVWDSSYRGWFYCSPSDGHMYVDGWYRINNKPYYFNTSGKLV